MTTQATLQRKLSFREQAITLMLALLFTAGVIGGIIGLV